MEKKNFNHGTMVGGIVRIVIALIAVLIAIIVLVRESSHTTLKINLEQYLCA